MPHIVQILCRDEIASVLAHLHRQKTRKGRPPNHLRQLAVFRLSCCCGLRRREIAGLQIADLELFGPRPVIRVRKEITKANRAGVRKARVVPLWWDSGTRGDLATWRDVRLAMTSGEERQPLVCGLRSHVSGEPLSPTAVARQWDTLLSRVLGPQRAKQLSIHCGRHSFCSHALHGGRSLVEVRDAAGHANISTTNIYAHAVECDAPDLFASIGEDD